MEALALAGSPDNVRPEVTWHGTWQNETAPAYKVANILDHPAYWQALSDLLLPFSKGKHMADLGCADGKLSTFLQAACCTNVDPYPPDDAEHVVEMDGVAYLQTLEDNSLDLVTSVVAIHHMNRAALEHELTRVLKPDGRAIWVSLCSSGNIFGEHTFNSMFFQDWAERDANAGLTDEPCQEIIFERDITHDQFSTFVAKRAWSNLAVMPQEKIDSMVSLIPDDLSRISFCLHVRQFFGMEPDREQSPQKSNLDLAQEHPAVANLDILLDSVTEESSQCGKSEFKGGAQLDMATLRDEAYNGKFDKLLA